MKIDTVHCLFEQSGTFKNAFKKYGIDSFDYDILNYFGQTDYVIDLFNEIDKAYEGKESVFDNIKQTDLILAFFPCVCFSAQFSSDSRGNTIKSLEGRIKHSLKAQQRNKIFYEKLCRLVLICLDRGLRLIVENPATAPQFLTTYSPFKPTITDKDRTERGDNFRKPTNYYYFNCEPSYNIVLRNGREIMPKTIKETRNKVERSMITSEYAENFIKEFILD